MISSLPVSWSPGLWLRWSTASYRVMLDEEIVIIAELLWFHRLPCSVGETDHLTSIRTEDDNDFIFTMNDLLERTQLLVEMQPCVKNFTSLVFGFVSRINLSWSTFSYSWVLTFCRKTCPSAVIELHWYKDGFTSSLMIDVSPSFLASVFFLPFESLFESFFPLCRASAKTSVSGSAGWIRVLVKIPPSDWRI